MTAAPPPRDPPTLAVQLATACLPAPVTEARPSLAWATGPGRIRDTTLAVWDRVQAEPERAGPILRHEMRRAHFLGSKGRAVASSVLYGLLRHERVLDLLLDRAGGDRACPLHRYLGWLVLAEGLEPESAAQQAPGVDFRVLAEAPLHVAAWARHADPVDALALGASLPRWLANDWYAELGPEAADLVAAFAVRPPMAVRVNTHRASREHVRRRLEQEGVPTTLGQWSPHALVFEGRRNVHVLPSFREGLYEVQDEGSQLIAALVGGGPGQRIVDYCAGAGGKSLALADSGAEVWALDVRSDALEDLANRSVRARLRVRADALEPGRPPPIPAGWADAVLVDAPCSASGVLRRHPEQRFRLTEAWVQERATLQALILDRAAALVRPGGRLVYATCSLLRRENQDVVTAFLGRHPRFHAGGHLGEGGVLWPHRTGTDGFYGVELLSA